LFFVQTNQTAAHGHQYSGYGPFSSRCCHVVTNKWRIAGRPMQRVLPSLGIHFLKSPVSQLEELQVVAEV